MKSQIIINCHRTEIESTANPNVQHFVVDSMEEDSVHIDLIPEGSQQKKLQALVEAIDCGFVDDRFWDDCEPGAFTITVTVERLT